MIDPTAPGNRAAVRAGYAFVAPALVLITVFFFLPVLGAFALSLTDFDLYAVGDPGLARFVGGENYARLLHDPVFWQALRNTFYFVLVGGPLSVAAALGAALLVNQRIGDRWKRFFRSVYFAPVVTTLVAVAIVWRYLYHPRFGLINWALGLVGVGPVDWLGSVRWAMPAVILLAVWKSFGYNMIILVAGLQSIPAELYEAATLDGANAWQRFRNVTLPQLAPMMLFVSVITMIGYFQLFAEPYVMTQGGPLRSTTSVVLYMYEEGFRWWRMGYAAAIAFVLFLVILAATLVQFRLQRRDA
ncbi:MAG TPA: sugar ABC transporter permease [Gemmatimonadaceae bacterium]|nr:sugar ABC transporter permease [Gemmatimonadaceae bacterium]